MKRAATTAEARNQAVGDQLAFIFGGMSDDEAKDEAPGLACASGRPWVNPSWKGPHHCDACAQTVEEACRVFAAAVSAGTYNGRGYTKREWAAAGRSPETWAAREQGGNERFEEQQRQQRRGEQQEG